MSEQEMKIKDEILRHKINRMHPQLTSFLKYKNLSAIERVVICEALKGNRHKASSEALGMKEKNFKWHLTKIYKKLGVKSRVEAIILLRDITTGELNI